MDRADLPKLTRRSVLPPRRWPRSGDITLAPAAAQEATLAAEKGEEHHPVFLFVQLAEQGTWGPSEESPDVFLLTLARVSSQTVYFTDRPDRIVGAMETSGFLESLGFTPFNPPNAAAVVRTPKASAMCWWSSFSIRSIPKTLPIPAPTPWSTRHACSKLSRRQPGIVVRRAGRSHPAGGIRGCQPADRRLRRSDLVLSQSCYHLRPTDSHRRAARRSDRHVLHLVVQWLSPCNNMGLYDYWDICNQHYPDCQWNCKAL